MSRLLLLRHAKAAWADPGTRDFDRPLTEAGRREAQAVGLAIAANGYHPLRIVCSPAKRALETWRGVAKPLGMSPGEALLSETLYASDGVGYLTIVRNNGAADTLLVIGHNPMIEDLAIALSANGDDNARKTLAKGFPTAGLAVLTFSATLAEAAPGNGQLDTFLIPADL